MTDHQRRPPPKSRREFPLDDDLIDVLADEADEYYQGAETPFADGGGSASVHHGHFGGHHGGGHHG